LWSIFRAAYDIVGATEPSNVRDRKDTLRDIDMSA
jgi:hypothetical protein